MAPQRITFIGIGNMGNTLAQTLHKAGHSTTIRHRTRHRLQVDKVIELGAELEQDAEIAISRSGGLVIICLLDHDTIHKTLDKVPSSAGKTVVNLTNGSPLQSTPVEE
ncbi:NAD(P)-binding domain protein, partial [Metarhizium majus ARSEF 297]